MRRRGEKKEDEKSDKEEKNNEEEEREFTEKEENSDKEEDKEKDVSTEVIEIAWAVVDVKVVKMDDKEDDDVGWRREKTRRGEDYRGGAVNL